MLALYVIWEDIIMRVIFYVFIFRERPRINSRTVDLRRLSELGDETFGRTYSNWLRDNVLNCLSLYNVMGKSKGNPWTEGCRSASC